MPKISFKTSYLNESEGLVISPSELLAECFYGITLCSIDGSVLSENILAQHIKRMQSDLERLLDVKLTPQIIAENHTFIQDEWRKWALVRTNYPVHKPYALDGFINTIRQIKYPKEWLSYRRSDQNTGHERAIYIIPTAASSAVTTFPVGYTGITTQVGLLGLQQVPNYWHATYLTGFKQIPPEIKTALMYKCAIPLYQQLGNGIIKAGYSSQSIALDGVSQSITIEPGGFASKIKQYDDMLLKMIPSLKQSYKGLTFSVA